MNLIAGGGAAAEIVSEKQQRKPDNHAGDQPAYGYSCHKVGSHSTHVVGVGRGRRWRGFIDRHIPWRRRCEPPGGGRWRRGRRQGGRRLWRGRRRRGRWRHGRRRRRWRRRWRRRRRRRCGRRLRREGRWGDGHAKLRRVDVEETADVAGDARRSEVGREHLRLVTASLLNHCHLRVQRHQRRRCRSHGRRQRHRLVHRRVCGHSPHHLKAHVVAEVDSNHGRARRLLSVATGTRFVAEATPA